MFSKSVSYIGAEFYHEKVLNTECESIEKYETARSKLASQFNRLSCVNEAL